MSHDRGQTYRFVANLPLAQFYHVAVDNEPPYNVYGGLQDNGSWRGPVVGLAATAASATTTGSAVGGGDGFETLPDPQRLARSGYALWQGGNLLRWNLRTGERSDIKPRAARRATKLRFNWNAGARPSIPSTPARSTSAASSSTARPTAARPGRSSAPTSPPTTRSGRSRTRAAA